MSETPKKRRPVIVTTHAVQRYKERFRDPSANLFDVADALRREINDAYETGRSSNKKLKRFKLYGESKRELPHNERFLYREDESMAWIVKETEGKLLVMTTLSPAWGYSEDVA
jgi:hypothetical protein